MSEHSAEKDAPVEEVWIPFPLPGGFICSRCGWPTESEPCEHLMPAEECVCGALIDSDECRTRAHLRGPQTRVIPPAKGREVQP